jgi:hypothetical protein
MSDLTTDPNTPDKEMSSGDGWRKTWREEAK